MANSCDNFRKLNYQIFLSYSHKDSELLGTEYIEDLKQQIEDSIGIPDSVFLDVNALHLGNDWNKVINEHLDGSKVFIYLLSSNYIASEYCNRERLWWKNKEMRNGKLSSNTLPIYFVEIPEEERNQETSKWIEQTNDKPWFDSGVRDELQKDVKARLAIAAEREAHIRQLLLRQGKDGLGILDAIRDMRHIYDCQAKSFSSVPCYNLDFVGRIHELAAIRSICIKRHSLQGIPVIYGPAGCGKSDLAFAYANGYAADYAGGRFLINMEDCHDWKSALIRMVTSYSGKSDEKQVSTTVCEELLGIKPEEFLKLDEDKRYQTVCSALERRCKNEYVKEECEKRVVEKRVLIVLDNVVDLELFQNDQLSGLFEHGIPKNLDIIATSRKRPENIPLFNANPEKKSLAVAYHLGNLDEESALELFRKHCVFADFNTNPPDNVENNPKNEQIRKETEAAREIIRLLDCHAWSICHIAGAFSECYKHLEPPDEEDGDPLEFGNKTCEQLLQELQEYFSEELTEKGHLRSVNIEEYADKVMRLTVEQISQLEAGKDILSCAAIITLFAPDFVPLRLLEAFWKYLHAEDSSVNWTVVKDTLLRHHILSGPKSKISRMHRLTWKYFRTYAAEYDVNLDESAKNFAAYIQDFVLTNALFQKEAAALIHLGEFWCRAPWADENFHFLLDTVSGEGGKHYLLPQLIKYRETCREKFRTESQDTPQDVSLYNFDALLSCCKADYNNALKYYNDCLEIQQKRLEPDHPDIAWTYGNMASVYDQKGDYDTALKYYNDCLVIQQKHLEPDHPAIATTYNNMALEYDYKGDYDTALKYYNDCLVIQQKRLEANHPAIATTYNNMASVYDQKGDYDRALKYYNDCLVIQQKRLEPDHPAIATTYGNMASVYDNKDDYDTALKYYNDCLVIRKKRLEPDHPDIATTYGNMASVYDNKGDYDTAWAYIAECCRMLINTFGEDDPYIQQALSLAYEVNKKLRRWGWWLKIKRFFRKKKNVE